MISKQIIEEAMYEAVRKAATIMPPDIEKALRDAMAEESDPLARKHMELTIENARLAAEGKGLVCGDTGYPLFFVNSGNNVQIEGGFGSLWKAAQAATARATADNYLRPTMVDPISRDNPGNNIGNEIPKVHLNFPNDSGSSFNNISNIINLLHLNTRCTCSETYLIEEKNSP